MGSLHCLDTTWHLHQRGVKGPQMAAAVEINGF